MESSKKRRINSGKEFDHLFPPPNGVDKSVKQRADVDDTLKLIRRTVPETLWQTREIAKVLKGRTLDETCSNIWHFVYDHIQYKRDEDGVEQVRSPRRTWWERKTGVDCDCYTEFISSILLNLNIPHKARITKYPKKPPEIPRWQHIYPVVPRNGRLNGDLADRDDYIVIDCVKDDYDDEQEFLEFKDYDMRLDYLDGIEDEREDTGWIEEPDYFQPDSVDASDLVSIYDDEELGNILKKVGSAVKTVAKKASTAVKTVAQDIKKTAPVLAKKVADDVGKGIRVVNRFANPATVLLRNGFLLAMKVNLFNVGGRLRYAYLTDAQARERGINVNTLQKVRAVKDRAETVYWQAGGKKENLKKAILQGKGNKDKKVPLSGLSGLDNVYMDMDEYRILHHGSDETQGLGEIASGAALTAASGAVAAIATALSQIKGLFDKRGKEEAAFQSETDNAGNASSLPANVSEDEDTLTDRTDLAPEQVEIPKPSFVPQTSAPTKGYVPSPPAPVSKPKPPAPKPPAPKPTPVPTQTPTQTINLNPIMKQRLLTILLQVISHYYQVNLPPAQACLHQVEDLLRAQRFRLHQAVKYNLLQMIRKKRALYKRLLHG